MALLFRNEETKARTAPALLLQAQATGLSTAFTRVLMKRNVYRIHYAGETSQ